MFPLLKTNLLISFETKENDLRSIIDNLFSSCSSAFESLNSDYKRISYLKENDVYITPETDIVGNELRTFSNRNSGNKYEDNVSIKGQYISIKSSLKNFLEMPRNFMVLKKQMETLNSMDPRLVKNFLHSNLWQDIRQKFPD